MTTCGSCSALNPEGARFCNQCGSAFSATPAPIAERRHVTVVFSDLSGFTAMSEQLDPEDVQSVMSEIFTEATRIITMYGGRVDKLIGDAVMAVFGDPVAHEDDAERAVRATMDIHAAVEAISPRLEPRIGRPLVMHSGINTGVVVTSAGSMDTADTGPLGDTINLASRLEDLSEPGEILLGPETSALVSAVFELDDHGAHDLRGKTGAVRVSRVSGLRASRVGASHRQGEFVGRHEELGLLLGAVEKVQDGVGSVIGIRAEAGAGKTRLIAEFRSRVRDRVQWLEGRAYAYGEHIPFAALVDLISNAVGIDEVDTQESIAMKLRDGIRDLVDDLDPILDPFHRLFGLEIRADAGLDKESFQPRLLESVTAVVEGLARRAPTVLVFQDLHWVDPSTLGILGALTGGIQSPIVIVANYRPAFEGSLPGVREVQLEPLSPRQTGELAASLLDTDSPPKELVDFLTARTDGNPFYLEEIVNSLIETGTLVEADGGWRITGSFVDADVPTSIRGVIAARIDRLETGRRRVLQEASVVGREFLYDIIRKVATATDQLDPSLSDLERADLIRERPDQTDLEYFFKHALTQDVAYDGLLKSERARLHARAAAAIEEQFAGRLEEVTETLAFHYSEGGVVDKAVHYLRRAGLKAMDRYALVEAQAHFERAYDAARSAEAGDAADRAIVETILDWSILFYYRATLPQLGELMDEHEDALDRLADDRLRMWWLIWRGHSQGFVLDHRHSLVYLDEARSIAARLDDGAARAYIETWRGWAFNLQGRLEEAAAVADGILPYAARHCDEDPYPYLKTLGQKALTVGLMGRFDEASAICDELVAFGRRVGNTRSESMGFQMRASYEIWTVNLAAAAGHADSAVEVAQDPVYEDSARMVRGFAAAASGDAEALGVVTAALSRPRAPNVRLVMPISIAALAAVHELMTGDPVDGFSRLLAQPARGERYGRMVESMFAESFTAIVMARLTTGEAGGSWMSLVRSPRVLKYLRKARREAQQRLETLIDGADDRRFGGIKPLLRYELAKLLVHSGRTDEARAHLELASDQVSGISGGEGARRLGELCDTI